MLDTRNYKVVEFSWNEKRQDLFSGIDTLPPVLKAEALAAIDLLNAKPPRPLAQSHPAEKDLNTTHFIVQFDQETEQSINFITRRPAVIGRRTIIRWLSFPIKLSRKMITRPSSGTT